LRDCWICVSRGVGTRGSLLQTGQGYVVAVDVLYKFKDFKRDNCSVDSRTNPPWSDKKAWLHAFPALYLRDVLRALFARSVSVRSYRRNRGHTSFLARPSAKQNLAAQSPPEIDWFKAILDKSGALCFGH